METNVQQAYDDADLNRAIQAYKFFYPTVSGAAIVGQRQIGLVPNKVFGILDCAPEQLVFTANSDTPYGPLLLDLGIGPLVVELAARAAHRVLDGHQPALGGRHGPARTRRRQGRQAPAAAARTTKARCRRPATTSIAPAATGRSSAPGRCRSNGDVQGAKERLKTIKVYPLNRRPAGRSRSGSTSPARSRTPRLSRGKTTSRSGRCCTRPSTTSRSMRATTTTTASSRRWASRRASRSRRTRA